MSPPTIWTMRIESLSPSQRVQGRWIAVLADGSKLKLTDREMVDFSLYAGLDLPEEMLAQLRDSAGESAARRRALNILSARPLSRRELEKRLAEKGETPAHAAAAADYMEHLGYLNDEHYAKLLAEHYAAKGYGPRKVRDELYRRGVPRELWDGALAELQEPDDALDALVAARLQRIPRPDRADLKRVSDALARRGYGWSDISAAIRRYQQEHEVEWEDETF